MGLNLNCQVTMRNLWFNHSIKEAIDAPRLHHQIYPMELGYEFGTLDVNLFLTSIGTKILIAFYIFSILYKASIPLDMKRLGLEEARLCAPLLEMENSSLQMPTTAEVLLLLDFKSRYATGVL